MPVRGTGRASRLVVAALAVLAAGSSLVGAGPAVAQNRCVSPGTAIRPIPWAQLTLDPDRVWSFTSGSNRTIAIVDTGIDANQAQLSGRVTAGTNVATGSGTGETDCAGHGTQVAGVISARKQDGIGLEGLAPGATLMPVAITAGDGSEVPADPGAKLLAKAITWATDHGADIITVPLPTYQDSPTLKSAVGYAHDHGALVVAATGDLGSEQNPTPYPADYPGVLGVGSLAQDGTVPDDSGYGDFVDLVGPGSQVTTTQAGHGQVTVAGSAYAAAFVSAVAALVWSYEPQLTVDQLVHRLEATAAPGGEAPPGHHYGWGIADAYQALTGQTDDGAAGQLPSAPAKHIDPAAQARARAWSSSLRWALLGTGIGVAAGLVVIAVALLLPRGRRRRWRSGTVAGPYDDPEADMPSPPVHLFTDEEAKRQ